MSVQQPPTFRRTFILASAAALAALGVPASVTAHDSNLWRWDLSSSGRRVNLTVRMSGAGLSTELQKHDPSAKWNEMSRHELRRRVTAYLEAAFTLREGKRELRPTLKELRLGHETTASLQLVRARKTPIEQFTLDLTAASSRKYQHHLVFVHRDEQRQRFMLRRSAGLVLHWDASMTTTGPAKNAR